VDGRGSDVCGDTDDEARRDALGGWEGGGLEEEVWRRKVEVVGIEAVDVDDVARGVDASSARARLLGG
jgi:hypothetical protein